MKSFTPIALSLCLLLTAGCMSLVPKKVEFLQDKVQKFPEATAKQVEYQKQAAWLAKEKASETLGAALVENSSTNIVNPAQDTAKLTDIVAASLGPPEKAATDTDKTVANLQAAIAKLERKIDSFKRDNDENAGKKIEGTGALQIPYFAYVGLIGLALFVLWHLGKLALTAASMANPGAAVGLGVMNVTGDVAGRGVTQLVKGGKKFIEGLGGVVEDSALKQKIADLFVASHKQAQDSDVKAVVDRLIK